MCMLGGAAATAEAFGSIGVVHAEKGLHKLDPLGDFRLFLPILRIADRMKTPALLIVGICGVVPCPLGVIAHVQAVSVR